MGERGRTFLAVLGAALTLLAVSAEAQTTRRGGRSMAALAAVPLPSASLPLEATDVADPLPGWTAFCAGNPAECTVDPADRAVVRLTPQAWRTLVAINREVNAAVEPLTDKDHWGVSDRWDLPTDGAGDCEDYQLLKRKLLVAAGLPARALRMTVVIDETGEGHAVLMARTDRGDFILDNKRNAVLPWHQTGYVFVKREGADGDAWLSLGRAAGPTATANR